MIALANNPEVATRTSAISRAEKEDLSCPAAVSGNNKTVSKISMFFMSFS